MDATIILSIVCIALVIGIAFLCYKVGVTAEKQKQAIRSLDALNKQADIAANRPNVSTLVDKLRNKQF